jgi:hypothetical protein
MGAQAAAKRLRWELKLLALLFSSFLLFFFFSLLGRSPDGRLNDLWVFDAESRTWEVLEENNAAGGPLVRSGSLLVHDGNHTLYVGFGYDRFPVAHNEMYKYYLYDGKWEGPLPIEGLIPAPRINFKSWFLNNHVWIFGGSPDGVACMGDLWKFNVETNVWTEVFPR